MERGSAHDKELQHLIERLSEQALAYAKDEYGEEHPVWRSIHDQLECFHCLGDHESDSCSARNQNKASH
jgi:hypothetical protein